MKGGILWAALVSWLVAASGVAADSATFTHDANGNLTSRTEEGVAWTYAYDSRDQLREVRRDGILVEVYQYDAQGRRVRKTGAGGVVRYVWDGDRIVEETDDFGNTVARYQYAGDRIVSIDHVTEGPGFYVLDALGSPVGLVRPDGTLAARYHLDAWGVLRAEEGDSPNPFRFTGHQFDEATGLYYAKARYYDPASGRFLSEDPFAGDGASPPSLHRYLYAYDNPTVFHDPTGRTSALTAAINWMAATSAEGQEAVDETSTTEQMVKTAIAAGLLEAGADITSGFNWVVNSIALSTPLRDTKVGLEARAELEQARERVRRAAVAGVQRIEEDPGGGVVAVLEAPDRIAIDGLNKAARAASGDRQAQAELIAEGARAAPGLLPLGVAGRARQAERLLEVGGDLPAGWRTRSVAPLDTPSNILDVSPQGGWLRVRLDDGREVVIRESAGADILGYGAISAEAGTSRSLITSINADLGEVASYKQALIRGEIGLQRPVGANISGPDSITASYNPLTNRATVFLNDAKTSGIPDFPAQPTYISRQWGVAVKAAVDRMRLGDPALEQAIRAAVQEGRVLLRHLNVDISAQGQGAVSGF